MAIRCLMLSAVICFGCQQPPSNDIARGEDDLQTIFAPTDETLRLPGEPIVAVGLDDSLPLHRVTGAVFFGDGFAIANGGYNEVLMLDSSGRAISRHGRRGNGPGEFINLAGVVRHRDGLVTWDAYHRRLERLDANGQYVEGTSVSVPTPPWTVTGIVGAFGNSVLLESTPWGFRGEGALGPLEVRQKVQFAVVRLSDGHVSFSTLVQGEEEWAQRNDTGERMNGGLPVIFGRRAVAAVTERRAYLADTDSLAFTGYDERGVGVTVSVPHHRVLANERWEAFVRDSMRAYSETRIPRVAEFRRGLLDGLPARSTLPAFSAMLGASDGRLWVREYPNPMQTSVVWLGFNDRFELEKRVETPVKLQVLDFARGRVLVRTRGEHGQDVVAVFSTGR